MSMNRTPRERDLSGVDGRLRAVVAPDVRRWTTPSGGFDPDPIDGDHVHADTVVGTETIEPYAGSLT